ncbi:flagella basal body P-ring formation protein FlgA [Gynuella sunshinyii]|uniref:Flagellar basal body P-ring biosynthesis protein n=1 Tax=Gynuella sunshinyii YC6258 TaxID=1445510 RepID=A0A0C5VDY8_9GAMM|nr:flagella basal body P-ring formation protein FlgA [Gynuella sunshinyii]AJQ92722.1 flagellar basal body P-ring biosynthesis protein [Gynuella sunshinyii YC6258]
MMLRLLLISLLGVQVSAAGMEAVTLREQVSVDSDWILLGDVLDFGSHPLTAKQQQIAMLTVARAPTVSHSLVLQRAFILRRLSSFSSTIELAGANEVEVRRQSQTIPAAQIRETLMAAIARELAAYEVEPGQYRVDGMERIHDIKVPTSATTDIRVDRFQPRLPASQSLAWVDIWENGVRVESLSIPIKLNLPQQVWSINRDMAVGDIIQARDLTGRQVNNADFAYWPKSQNIVGLEIKQPLTAGASLHQKDLGPQSLFVKDQVINATLNIAGVTVDMPVRVLQPLNRGDHGLAERNNGRKVEISITADGQAEIIGKYEE